MARQEHPLPAACPRSKAIPREEADAVELNSASACRVESASASVKSISIGQRSNVLAQGTCGRVSEIERAHTIHAKNVVLKLSGRINVTERGQ